MGNADDDRTEKDILGLTIDQRFEDRVRVSSTFHLLFSN